MIPLMLSMLILLSLNFGLNSGEKFNPLSQYFNKNSQKYLMNIIYLKNYSQKFEDKSLTKSDDFEENDLIPNLMIREFLLKINSRTFKSNEYIRDYKITSPKKINDIRLILKDKSLLNTFH